MFQRSTAKHEAFHWKLMGGFFCEGSASVVFDFELQTAKLCGQFLVHLKKGSYPPRWYFSSVSGETRNNRNSAEEVHRAGISPIGGIRLQERHSQSKFEHRFKAEHCFEVRAVESHQTSHRQGKLLTTELLSYSNIWCIAAWGCIRSHLLPISGFTFGGVMHEILNKWSDGTLWYSVQWL